MNAATARRFPRVAAVMVAGLLVLGFCRIGLVFVPRMDLWSLNLLRFLSAPEAWGPWLFAIVVLLFRSRLARGFEIVMQSTASGWVCPMLWATAAAALVLLLPDQTCFTGDLILRQRTVEEGTSPQLLFPQAMPLDVWLHFTVPRFLYLQYGVSPNAFARAWGAASAALLALSAVAFARGLRLGPTGAFAATGALVFTGSLGLFTGYAKGLADLVVLVVALCGFGATVVARGSGRFALLLSVATAMALHRMGLLFLPAAIAAYAIDGTRRGWSRRHVAAVVGCLAVAAVIGPRAIQTVLHVDVPTHLAFNGSAAHWLDVFNALLLIAPLLPLAPIIVLCDWRGWLRPEVLPSMTLALFLVVPTLFVTPQQGPLRDWDVYAPAGMALAVLTAWLSAEAVTRVPASPHRGPHAREVSVAATLAVALVLAAAAPSIQWLLHLNDAPSGMRRVTAAIVEPPRRSVMERARLWDYLGIRNAWLDRWDTAANAFAHSAQLLPTPRVLEQWAKAEIQSGDWIAARNVCLTWTHRTPDDPNAWRTLAATVTHLNDRIRSRQAAEQILRLAPDDPDARDILGYLDRTAGGPR